jgi:hypothetical protein
MNELTSLIDNLQISKVLSHKIESNDEDIEKIVTLVDDHDDNIQNPSTFHDFPNICKINKIIQYPATKTGEVLEGSIYILIEREFRKTKETIYKIGKTRCLKNRMGDYPKGSLLLFCRTCSSIDNAEIDLLMIFNETFIQRKDIGTEYFEGDINEMMEIAEGYFYEKNHSNVIKIDNLINENTETSNGIKIDNLINENTETSHSIKIDNLINENTETSNDRSLQNESVCKMNTTCFKCSKILSCSKSLKRHEKLSCKGEIYSLQCKKCSKYFTTMQSLKYHTKNVKCTVALKSESEYSKKRSREELLQEIKRLEAKAEEKETKTINNTFPNDDACYAVIFNLSKDIKYNKWRNIKN